MVTICHFDIPLNLVDKYGSWRNRKVIDFYLTYCDAVFRYFRDKVRYWITFNEINMLMHLPFMGAGIRFSKGENETEVKYQAAHNELVASAYAVKLAHEIDPECQVGCMLAAGSVYPYSCRPEDVWESRKRDRENYFFIDIQARGTIRPMRGSCWSRRASRYTLLPRPGTLPLWKCRNCCRFCGYWTIRARTSRCSGS